MAIEVEVDRVRHDYERRGASFWILNFGFWMILWVSEIQDEKQQFLGRDRIFLGTLVSNSEDQRVYAQPRVVISLDGKV
jgi:hypothetical protein